MINRTNNAPETKRHAIIVLPKSVSKLSMITCIENQLNAVGRVSDIIISSAQTYSKKATRKSLSLDTISDPPEIEDNDEIVVYVGGAPCSPSSHAFSNANSVASPMSALLSSLALKKQSFSSTDSSSGDADFRHQIVDSSSQHHPISGANHSSSSIGARILFAARELVDVDHSHSLSATPASAAAIISSSAVGGGSLRYNRNGIEMQQEELDVKEKGRVNEESRRVIVRQSVDYVSSHLGRNGNFDEKSSADRSSFSSSLNPTSSSSSSSSSSLPMQKPEDYSFHTIEDEEILYEYSTQKNGKNIMLRKEGNVLEEEEDNDEDEDIGNEEKIDEDDEDDLPSITVSEVVLSCGQRAINVDALDEEEQKQASVAVVATRAAAIDPSGPSPDISSSVSLLYPLSPTPSPIAPYNLSPTALSTTINSNNKKKKKNSKTNSNSNIATTAGGGGRGGVVGKQIDPNELLSNS